MKFKFDLKKREVPITGGYVHVLCVISDGRSYDVHIFYKKPNKNQLSEIEKIVIRSFKIHKL